jgi:hypothetical protein
MFKNLSDKLTEKIGEIGDSIKDAIKAQNTPLDLSKFNNPIADKTDWSPLKPGGTNFRTHKFSKEQGAAYFKATKGSLVFSGFFMILGLIVPLVIFTQFFMSNNSFMIAFSLIPVVFFIAGFFILRHSTKPIVFNKNTGYFWKGRLKENENPAQKPLKVYCKLIDIVALQIISERVRSSSSSSSGGSSSFRSYEINLILQDASRLNVIDHGNRSKLMEDAEQLASYLGVPIWDGNRY